MGGAATRDRFGCLAQWLSPPRRLSPRECRYAWVLAGGAASPRPHGGLSPAQAGVGRTRGARAALGSQRDLLDRSAAAGRTVASRAQPDGTAADRAESHPALVGSAISGPLVEGSPADLGRSAAGDRLSTRQRVPLACVQSRAQYVVRLRRGRRAGRVPAKQFHLRVDGT